MNGFVKARLISLLNKTEISSVKEAKFPSDGKVLILSPHYDDDVLSCYAAMAKHIEHGAEIHILYITDGSASKESGMDKEALCNVRKQEATTAIQLFFPDVKLMHLGKKDGAFFAEEKDVIDLSNLLKKEKYEYIYSPSYTDTHQDHIQTYELLKLAIIKTRHSCLIRLYEFWYPLKHPNVFVSLQNLEEQKWQSISCHKSQLNYLNYVEFAQIVNQHRGIQTNCRYCEVFEEISSMEMIPEDIEQMKVSLVIPAYSNEIYVAMMLKSLMKQKCDFKEWEILLVDDSEDNRMTQFEDWNIANLRVLEKEHSGRADTRNVGIRNSKGEVIIFMDSDIIVGEKFVQDHYDSHTKGECDISIGKVNHIANENLEAVRQYVQDSQINRLDELVVTDDYLHLTSVVFQNREVADYIGWVCCLFSNCSVKREVLEKSGVFDDSFQGWGLEDIELGYRFFKNQFKFSYFDEIQNFHVDHVTNSDKMLVEMGQNLKRLFKKHPDAAIRSYMSFVAGFKDLQELVCDISQKKIEFTEGLGVFFKPIKYTKSKA